MSFLIKGLGSNATKSFLLWRLNSKDAYNHCVKERMMRRMGVAKTELYFSYIIHLGETLYDLLEDREMTQTELAIRVGVSPNHIAEVISGNASISLELASALENVFGTTASFWLNL